MSPAAKSGRPNPKRPRKIDLSTIPELEGLTIIRTQAELDSFTSKLRQDWYSKESDAVQALQEKFDVWIKTKVRGVTFILVEDEPDNFAKNDDWGRYHVFEGMAVRDSSGQIRVTKISNSIAEFAH